MNYKEFINNILDTRGRFSCGKEYHERHHIIPKCLGGTNEQENLIDLYAREHYEAHRLLALENSDVKQLTYAWWLMSNAKNDFERRYILTAEEYEEARIRYSNIMKEKVGHMHPNYGKHISEEQKAAISKAHKGKKLSDELCKKWSNSHKGIASGSKNPMAKKVVCDGIEFGCIVECANYYGVTDGAMKMWLTGANRMPKKFINMGLRYCDSPDIEYKEQTGCRIGKNHQNSKRVYCDGIIFDTLSSCSKFYDIPNSTMSNWLVGRNRMPKKFIDMNLHYLNGGDEYEK